MSHCSKQIRDWFATIIDAVVGVPTPIVGAPRQIAENTDYVYVKSVDEAPATLDIHKPGTLDRVHSIDVVIVANTYDEVDAYSVLIEEALSVGAAFPAKILDLTSRAYEEDKTTDRDYVALTLNYAVRYFVLASDVETFL